MKLETLLSASEMSAFNDLVHQAAAKGAQAVRWHSAQHNLLVIGICDAGEVLTWFAAPAGDASQAQLAEMVVLSGCAQVGNAMQQMNASAAGQALMAIQKAKGQP